MTKMFTTVMMPVSGRHRQAYISGKRPSEGEFQDDDRG